LEEALANLPAPQFEYELGVPEDVAMEMVDENEGVARMVTDRADEDREDLERLRRLAETMYEEQSSVMKRGELPRPRGGMDVLNRLSGSLVDSPNMDRDEVA
jgi:hypothetical protein